jgi:fucose 4-O-acetylase-like acetyltransferase
MRRLFRYETCSEPLASRSRFTRRLLNNGLWALAIVLVAQLVGMAGYLHFEGLSVIDSFTNAAMVLSGVGPTSELRTAAGKIFVSLYAVASGLLIFAVAGLMLAPVYHRILNRFHVQG